MGFDSYVYENGYLRTNSDVRNDRSVLNSMYILHKTINEGRFTSRSEYVTIKAKYYWISVFFSLCLYYNRTVILELQEQGLGLIHAMRLSPLVFFIGDQLFSIINRKSD